MAATTQKGQGAHSGRRERVINYVPGEICVVAVLEQGVHTEAVYEQVRHSLNRGIPEALKRAMSSGGDLFEQDLAPTALAERHAGSADVLLPLNAANGRMKSGPLEPWVVLRRGEAHTNALYFYGIAGEPAEDKSQQHRNDLYVRELVNLINRHLLAGSVGEEIGTGWTLAAATPNWLMAGTPEPETCPGPASRPEPSGAPPAWRFAKPELGSLMARATPDQYASGVTVAVLDTSPSAETVETAAQRFTQNQLLQTVAMSSRAVKMDGPLSVVPPPPASAQTDPPRYMAHLKGIFANWLTRIHRPAEHFWMPDHGLFAAGIIRDLAPAADVHLIRVLNEYGVGDLQLLTQVWSKLPETFLQGPDSRLVINMSLVCDVPISERLLNLWFPRASQDLKTMRERWADMSETLQTIHSSLAESIGWLQQYRDRVLVVAAAGNDNLDRQNSGQARPEPRYPARYDDVLGVAAVKTGGAADYSNRGDIVVMGNGVAVYGGNAALDPNGGPPVIPPKPSTTTSPAAKPGGSPNLDAITGIYTSDFPLSAPPAGPPVANTSGWAYWSGTSFATPVVSAIAANYWAEPANRGQSPSEVIAAIRAFQQQPNGALDVPAIAASQS